MRKIMKTLAISLSMTLVFNLQAFSVFGEEILPDPVIETEAEADADTDAEAGETVDVDMEEADVDAEEEPKADMAAVSVTEEELPEEAETENELCAGSYTPEGASYSLTYDVLDDDTIKITGCEGTKSGELIIPSEIEEKAVTVIGGNAFRNCSGFTGSLTIPDSVTTIGDDAFYNCTGFDGSLTIPDSVTTIGDGAFYKCGFTGSLTIPDSVTAIGNQAFRDCSSFTGDLIFPDGIKKIGNNAFNGCSGFTGNLFIPGGVETISEYSFHGCSGFNGNLTISEGTKKLSIVAFGNCSGFTGTLTIPSTISSIGSNALTNCSGFRKVAHHARGVATSYNLPNIQNKTWIDVKTGEVLSGGTPIRYRTVIRSDFYEPMDAPCFTHDPVEAQTYTGKAIKPAVKVYFGTKALEEKTDYTIKFANNTNAGMASFTVTGKGNYAGNDSDSFEILKKKLTEDDITLTEPAAAKYTKREQTPVPKITYNGMTLKKGKDFEIAYFSDEYFREWCIPKEPGKYYLKITGTGNYEGELETTFVIVNPKKKPVSTLKADKIADKPYANGEAIELTDEELIIRDGKTPLTKGTEYEIDGYSDNTLPGTARVTIRGIEKNGYVGTLTLTFKIKGTPINKATITAPADVTYNGSEQESEPEVKLNDTPLIKDTDYELIYDKNTNVGKAKVTIKGIGGYTGSVSKTFTIRPADMKDTSIQLIPADTESGNEYPYVQSGVQPGVTVKLGTLKLKEGRDYTLKYADNKAVTGASTKQPTVTITGKGNFTGKVDIHFVITAANINTCKVTAEDVIYKDKNGNWKTKKVSVLGTDGKALKAGKDYDDKTIRYTLEDDEGADGIEPGAKLDAGTMVYVWVGAKGANYTGTVKGTYRIVKQDIGKLTATLDPKAYTGKEVKLVRGDIRWKSGTKAVNDVTFDFDESSYKNNVNKGKATVIVKGTGNYGGTKTVTFTIGSKGILWWWRNLFN